MPPTGPGDLPPGTVYSAGEPERFGRFQVRTEQFPIERICPSCRQTESKGLASGCPECVTRSVMES